MLGVLTNKLYLLSKPVTPDFCKALLLNATAKIVQKMENGKLFCAMFFGVASKLALWRRSLTAALWRAPKNSLIKLSK